MNGVQIPDAGTSPRPCDRQSFVDAEVAKAGGIQAFRAKYGIAECGRAVSEDIIDTWSNGYARRDLREMKTSLFREGVPESQHAGLDETIRVVEQALERLDEAYEKAGGGD